jgi:hypothetical protein
MSEPSTLATDIAEGVPGGAWDAPGEETEKERRKRERREKKERKEKKRER